MNIDALRDTKCPVCGAYALFDVQRGNGEHFGAAVCSRCRDGQDRPKWLDWIAKPAERTESAAARRTPENRAAVRDARERFVVCAACGCDDELLRVHHSRALQDDGATTPGNMVMLCNDCHYLATFMQRLRRRQAPRAGQESAA